VGDADEQAHQRDALVRGAIKVGDLVPMAEGGIETCEAGGAIGHTDRNPVAGDEVEWVHMGREAGGRMFKTMIHHRVRKLRGRHRCGCVRDQLRDGIGTSMGCRVPAME